MPFRDPERRRACVRESTRRWRARHRCLTTTEIEERVRQLGNPVRVLSKIETVSLDDPRVEKVVERTVYYRWLQQAS